MVTPFEGFELPLEHSGSGIEMAVSLALLEAMAAISKQSLIVLIDEPELHLHPKLQSALCDHLVEMSSDIQVVSSTHSPVLFRNVFSTPSAKLLITEKQGLQVRAHDAHALGFGHLKWSPSWGEICYLAYDLPTVEFLDDLYSTVEDGLKVNPWDRVSQDDVEQWLIERGESFEKQWRNGKTGAVKDETLITYVRNSVHHPDNPARPGYTQAELRESIRRLCAHLKP